MKNKKVLIVYSIIIAIVILTINSGLTYELRNWLKIQIPNLDKVGHFVGMGILAFLALRTFVKQEQKHILKHIILVIISVLAFATAEEFSQKFLVFRSFQYWDLVANYLGILSFSVFYIFINSKQFKTLKPIKS